MKDLLIALAKHGMGDALRIEAAAERKDAITTSVRLAEAPQACYGRR